MMSGKKTILGPEEYGISDLINYSLVESAEKEEAAIKEGMSKRSAFRPSSAGECERALTYKAMEYTGKAYYEKKVPEANVQLIFKLGHAIEAMLLDAFDSVEFFDVKYKQQVLEFFKLETGDPKIDGIVEGSNDLCMVATNGEWKGIIDIKSKATGVGTYRRTKWQEMDDKLRDMSTVKTISTTAYYVDDPEAFIEELDDPFMAMNLWQLNLYALSDFMKNRGFNFASLLYFSKDTSQLREIRFKPSQSMYEKVQLRFERAAKAAAQSAPHKAKQEFILGSIKCAYCPYVTPCWGVDSEAAVKESYKNLPPKKWPINLDKVDAKMADKVRSYHELAKTTKNIKAAEQEIMKYMNEKNLDKVVVKDYNGEELVYEFKKLKTTVQLKRSKK